MHWTFSIAVAPDDPTQPPNLRTVGVQRVSKDGIDFIMKAGCGTSKLLASGKPLSILHLQGRYMPGETVEQWRGEGVCETRPLGEIVDKLPHYSIVAMLSSKSIEREKGDLVEELRDGVSGVCGLSFLYGWIVIVRATILSSLFFFFCVFASL